MFKVFMSIKSIFSVFFNVSNYLESLFLLFVQFYLVNFIDSVSFCSLNINFLVVNVIDFLLAGILLLDMTIWYSRSLVDCFVTGLLLYINFYSFFIVSICVYDCYWYVIFMMFLYFVLFVSIHCFCIYLFLLWISSI